MPNCTYAHQSKTWEAEMKKYLEKAKLAEPIWKFLWNSSFSLKRQVKYWGKGSAP
jgi:hypothetical protein